MDSNHNSININDGYVRTSCAQQNPHLLTSYAMPNNIPQQLMYNAPNQSMYNIMYSSQPIYRNQSTFPVSTSLQSVDSVPWSSEQCITNSELTSKDKYDDNKLKETNSSCCGPPLSEVYKTVNKNFYYNKNSIMDSHWFYSTNYDNQKYRELPSCSQITSDNSQCCDLKDNITNIKSVKYCSIQKYPETDTKLFMYTNKFDSNNDMFINQQYHKMTKEYSSCSQSYNLYDSNAVYAESEKKAMQNHEYFPTNDTILHFDDKATEESNGGGAESDIVVEDSEEEVSDESDDAEKDESQMCFVCRTSTTANQSYAVTPDSPLTSYSQTPVYAKLTNILGASETISSHICNTCMHLVNTADNLEVQLNAVKQKLTSKYQTFKHYAHKKDFHSAVQPLKKLRPKKRRFQSRDVCGIHSFKCSVCEKIFSLKKFYLFHMAKHKIKTKYLCDQCGCSFVKRSNLLTHLRKHTECDKSNNMLQIKTFVCHMCGKIFKTRTNLREHEYVCSGNLPFNCNLCERRFASCTKLKQHIQLKHEKAFSATCPTCAKGFVKQSDLKAHLLTHSAIKKFQCSKCDKTYKTLSNLNYHMKSHNEKLPFTCTLCTKGFLRKENLHSHLNLHNGLKPFGCSICEKKFASQKNLDAHLKIHNGTAKQKICPFCGKQISHGLEEHIRTHSSVKELQCDICSMKFLTKGALAKHRKRKHDNTDVDVL